MKLEQLREEYYKKAKESEDHISELEKALIKTNPGIMAEAGKFTQPKEQSAKQKPLYPIQLYSKNGALPMTLEAAAESIALDCQTMMLPATDLDASSLNKIARDAYEKALNLKGKMVNQPGKSMSKEHQILQGVNMIMKEFQDKRMKS